MNLLRICRQKKFYFLGISNYNPRCKIYLFSPSPYYKKMIFFFGQKHFLKKAKNNRELVPKRKAQLPKISIEFERIGK